MLTLLLITMMWQKFSLEFEPPMVQNTALLQTSFASGGFCEYQVYSGDKLSHHHVFEVGQAIEIDGVSHRTLSILRDQPQKVELLMAVPESTNDFTKAKRIQIKAPFGTFDVSNMDSESFETSLAHPKKAKFNR